MQTHQKKKRCKIKAPVWKIVPLAMRQFVSSSLFWKDREKLLDLDLQHLVFACFYRLFTQPVCFHFRHQTKLALQFKFFLALFQQLKTGACCLYVFQASEQNLFSLHTNTEEKKKTTKNMIRRCFVAFRMQLKFQFQFQFWAWNLNLKYQIETEMARHTHKFPCWWHLVFRVKAFVVVARRKSCNLPWMLSFS